MSSPPSAFFTHRWLALPMLAVLTACATRPIIFPAVAPVPAVVPAEPMPEPTTEPAPVPAPADSSAQPASAAAASPAIDAASAPAAVESAAVSARFPEPAVSYATPAFEPGRTGFTTNAELQALLRGLVRNGGPTPGATTVRLIALGSSQTGVPLEALHLTRDAEAAMALPVRPPRPAVLLIGQQHGDEPAGSEALLVIAQELAQGRLQGLLDRIDVVILPRANPDGAAAAQRLTASGVDVNRDHLLLKTPEAQAQAQLVREFAPLVVVDAHEYTVAGRFVQKFGAVQRFDALVQYAMTANLPEFISKASEEWFRRPLLARLKADGLSAEWYYTTSTDLADNKLSMGGAQPDTGRNVNGLKNAVSILIETRGVGIGRLHLKRRVHTQVVAIGSVLASAAARAVDLARLRKFVDAEVSAKACQGDAVVQAEATPSEYSVLMLDPVSGADKTVSVAWDSTLVLTPTKTRPRPCGYWLSVEQADAAMRLRALGVQVQRVDELGVVRGETYRETAREVGARQDVRGSVADAGGGVLRVKVNTVPALIDMAVGSYYVGLDQPLANLVLAALEPDTQNSYFANRIVSGLGGQARLLARPEFRMSPLR